MTTSTDELVFPFPSVDDGEPVATVAVGSRPGDPGAEDGPTATQPSGEVGERVADPFPDLAELPIPAIDLGPESNRELNHLRGQAFAEGRAAGFEQGLFEGRARAEAEVQRETRERLAGWFARLDDAVDELRTLARARSGELSALAVDLALDLAQEILGREIAAAADPGRDAIVRALDLAPEDAPLIAHLHPEDLERCGDVSELVTEGRLSLVADPTVGVGGCVLESGATRIDARIDTAMDRVRDVLTASSAAERNEGHR